MPSAPLHTYHLCITQNNPSLPRTTRHHPTTSPGIIPSRPDHSNPTLHLSQQITEPSFTILHHRSSPNTQPLHLSSTIDSAPYPTIPFHRWWQLIIFYHPYTTRITPHHLGQNGKWLCMGMGRGRRMKEIRRTNDRGGWDSETARTVQTNWVATTDGLQDIFQVFNSYLNYLF